MKKTLLVLLFAIQSTAAFATTQVLKCTGMESDELGETRKEISAEIKIVNPSVQTLLVINGEKGASARASIQISGLPAIQVQGINVTNLRKAISISGYHLSSFSVTAYVPVPSLGKTGAVKVDLSRVTSNNEYLRTALSCDSSLINSL